MSGLSSRDGASLKQVKKLYDSKQFKKAIKTCDGILKSNPNHGETLSMKALCLCNVGKTDEAQITGKLGLSKDLKNHICWYNFGLIQRSVKNYTEAIKCFRKAIKLESPGKLAITKDVGVLQIQSRDLIGFCATRKDLISQQPAQSSNWVAFSLAHHLLGNYAMAKCILEVYIKSALDKNRKLVRNKYEESELHLYFALLLEESGDLEGALNHMKEYRAQIVDNTGVQEKTASLLMKLGRLEEAKDIYHSLVTLNPECYDFHRGFQPSEMELMRKTYDELLIENAKASSLKRIPLDFLTGTEFETRAEQFLKTALRKGVPSLFSLLSSIYKTAVGNNSTKAVKAIAAAKVETLGKLVRTYLGELDKSETDSEPPTVKLWCLFYLAQHFDILGQQQNFSASLYLPLRASMTLRCQTNTKQEDALQYIERAIEHTPTLVDLYHVKGRILKHCGDIVNAAVTVEEGRKLDLADKWINSKSAKFQLRANSIDKAESIISLFTRHEGDGTSYLVDMQCMWYEIEAGHAYLRSGNLAMALKFFGHVEDHFDVFVEDQLDFHNYCMRKSTVRAYLNMLRLEDRIRGHKFFARAAHGSIQCYLRAVDFAKLYKKQDDAPDYSKMTGAERKKAKAKARKAEQKKRKQQEEEKAKQQQQKENEKTNNADDDPTGEKLLESVMKGPLDRASKLVGVLTKYAGDSLQTHLDCFDIQVRRGKYLQSIRAMYSGVRLVGQVQHPEIFPRLVPLLCFIEKGAITYAPWAGKATCDEDRNVSVSVSCNLSPVAREVISQVTAEMLGKSSANDLAKSYYEQYQSSEDIDRRIAACKTMVLVSPSEKRVDILSKLVNNVPEGLSFKGFVAIHDCLHQFGALNEKFFAILADRYPRQTTFSKTN